MSDREEQIEVMARTVYETQRWSDGALAATTWSLAGDAQHERMRDEARRALDALADSGWEIVRLEQVGWLWSKEGLVPMDAIERLTGVPPAADWVSVFRKATEGQ